MITSLPSKYMTSSYQPGRHLTGWQQREHIACVAFGLWQQIVAQICDKGSFHMSYFIISYPYIIKANSNTLLMILTTAFWKRELRSVIYSFWLTPSFHLYKIKEPTKVACFVVCWLPVTAETLKQDTYINSNNHMMSRLGVI